LRIAFAKPYLLIGQMPLVRREDAARYAQGFPENSTRIMGVIRASTGDFLVQENFPGNQRKEFLSGEEGAKALMKKKIDLFICDAPTIWWLAGTHESDNLVAVPISLSQESLAWGLRRSNTMLLESVNRALQKMQENGEEAKIIKRWIPLFK
jgi:ABC-type amino acid transport substrate-binding protein